MGNNVKFDENETVGTDQSCKFRNPFPWAKVQYHAPPFRQRSLTGLAAIPNHLGSNSGGPLSRTRQYILEGQDVYPAGIEFVGLSGEGVELEVSPASLIRRTSSSLCQSARWCIGQRHQPSLISGDHRTRMHKSSATAYWTALRQEQTTSENASGVVCC